MYCETGDSKQYEKHYIARLYNKKDRSQATMPSQTDLPQSHDFQYISDLAASTILDLVAGKPDACIALPTGHTPIAMYASLVRQSKARHTDWSSVRCFALDDYLDAPADATFEAFLAQHILDPLEIPAAHRFSPVRIDDYDRVIADCGGLDLTILGIGLNGHIAFNEPGTPPASYTHCVWLTESTRLANRDAFASLDVVPHTGITMGVASIQASRKILLLAQGKKKQAIVEQAFKGPITADVPASLLQNHGDLHLMCDFWVR